MFKYSRTAGILTAAIFALTWGAPVQAQAIRTWVSGVGDDANPCSRTAPCKTFPGAIPKTAAGGEIDVLDPGSFGNATITKSMTIDGSGGSIAGATTSMVNGFTVNDSGAGTAVVTIRNVSIFGEGFNTAGTPPGVRGIGFSSGAALYVQHCFIREFRDATNGTGISFTPSTNSKLFVDDSDITGNGTLGTDGGIVVKPTGSASAFVVVTRSRIENNAAGIRADSSGTTGTVRGKVSGSEISGNAFNGITAISGTGVATLYVDGDGVAGNLDGLVVNGTAASLYATQTVVTGNGTGLLLNPTGHLFTYHTNSVNNNTISDGAFTDVLVPE